MLKIVLKLEYILDELE